MEAIERIDRFLKVMAQLHAVIKRENELLAAHKTRGLAAIVDEKKKLSGVYEQHIKALQEKGALDGVDEGVRQRLRERIDGFAELLDENRIRVQATLAASRRMFEIIAESVKEYSASNSGYGETGTIGGSTAKAYRPALSVGVNQEL